MCPPGEYKFKKAGSGKNSSCDQTGTPKAIKQRDKINLKFVSTRITAIALKFHRKIYQSSIN